MPSTNKIFLVGNLGKDPESKATQSGNQVVSISVATTDKWRDKQTGNVQESTEWHNCRSFKEHVNNYLMNYAQKGCVVSIEGKSKTFKWTDQSGVKKSMQYFDIQNVEIISGGRDHQQSQQNAYQAPQRTNPNGTQSSPYANVPASTSGYAPPPSDDGDDIPF